MVHAGGCGEYCWAWCVCKNCTCYSHHCRRNGLHSQFESLIASRGGRLPFPIYSSSSLFYLWVSLLHLVFFWLNLYLISGCIILLIWTSLFGICAIKAQKWLVCKCGDMPDPSGNDWLIFFTTESKLYSNIRAEIVFLFTYLKTRAKEES